MKPDLERLSRQLRDSDDPFLRARRRIAGLSLLGAGSMALITLYQLGLIRRVPEPPLPGLDADRVDASGEAYRVASTPDGALGVLGYGITLVLAAAGGAERARTAPWLPLLLLAKVGFDAVVATKLTVDQATRHRAFCSWCLVAATSTFAMVPSAIPEAAAALRHAGVTTRARWRGSSSNR